MLTLDEAMDKYAEFVHYCNNYEAKFGESLHDNVVSFLRWLYGPEQVCAIVERQIGMDREQKIAEEGSLWDTISPKNMEELGIKGKGQE